MIDRCDAGFVLRSVHQPVMGTHLELQITASDEPAARAAEAAVVADALALAARFTVFDATSELCRWRAGQVRSPSPELAELLVLAARWQERSHGTFNPMAGVLGGRWIEAVSAGVVPDGEELAALAAAIAEPRVIADPRAPGGVRCTGGCEELDLNAVAKGRVVDLVAASAMAGGSVYRLVVNAGGDLVHRGAGSVVVGIEDPHRAYDNATPMARIEIADAAVATSGRARRWFDVGGRRWSRVIDPRSGWPVEHAASATVVAPDAATADVMATIASVLAPVEAVGFVDRLAAQEGIDAACLVVDAAGARHASTGWAALER